jgi:proline iminopeptidase
MLDGVRFTYHVHGTGPVCVVYPGGPGFDWRYLRLPMLEEHLTTVYVEPPGSGNSGLLPGGDYAIERYAGFADHLVRHLGESKVFLLGHSHGAFVALQTALDFPGRLAGVIVYGGAAFYSPELFDQAYRNIEAWVARRPPGDPLSEQIVQAWHDEPPEREAHLAAFLRLLPMYFKDYDAVQDGLTDWVKTIDITLDPDRQEEHWDIRDRLGEVAVPTLVLVGAADFITPLNSARELSDGIPGAELAVLPDSGHFAHLEEPDAFRNSVLHFVRRVS